MKQKHTYPNGVLRFVISNISPFIHLQEPPTKRVVTIELTPEQREALKLKWTGTNGGIEFFENISDVFFEQEPQGEQDDG